ncbi:chaperone NapD (plasmid) [Roseomonas sp. OT10]|uniref:chaperone NapD n=1 Tax=Roseomonas cutis TaxID=2897332 RepID=UPI001E413486|nr:chaperone NapD [Roseomonas sp. OT10]UFN51632.1 chaperone NapD [Roseomonas sp. OT10]
MPDEFHVSSLVVHCHRERAAGVAAVLGGMDGVEVHGGVPEGRLVVTLETTTESDIVERLGQVQCLDGVLAANLVFHQFEPSHPREAGAGKADPAKANPGQASAGGHTHGSLTP